MLRNGPNNVLAGAVTIAASLFMAVPAAISGSVEPVNSQSQYLPIQSISHTFGSKFMSGYFIQKSDVCFVTIMVIEKSDPESAAQQTATRLRLPLNPGEIAGLDSEEGHSINLTCGKDGAMILVDIGEMEKLAAQQSLTLPKDVAKSQ